MSTTTPTQNWIISHREHDVKGIHHPAINIAIWQRDISSLHYSIQHLLQRNIEFQSQGTVAKIMDDASVTFDAKVDLPLLQDIQKLLQLFADVSGASSFRLMLAGVNTNMCRKFHTDINDLRMICTYSGPGTLWLKNETLDQYKHKISATEDDVEVDTNEIQQAATGAVVILKGAIYPAEGTQAIVHRSPTIEETGQKRLLLRIDTNEFLNFE